VLRRLVGRLRAVVDPVGRLVDQRVERLDRAPGAEPVACVALVGEAGELEETNTRRLADERAGNGLGMIPSGLVVVGQHDDIGASELIGVGLPPLAGTARIAGRHDAKVRQRLDILLALDDEHTPLRGDRFGQVGQAVENAGNALEIPDPATLAVGPPLAECFWGEPDDLEQQRSKFVGVVVTRDDLVLKICAAVAGVAVTVLAQPFPRIVDALAIEEIEHPAAFAGLVVEP
jgi:hypothetical protein